MEFVKVTSVLVALFLALSSATPVSERKSLSFEDDPFEYIKEQAIAFFDGLLREDKYKVTNDVTITKNNYRSSDEESRKSNPDIEDKVESYIKSHDVTIKVPLVGDVTLGTRNMDNDEIDLKVSFGNGVQEARKSKLKKIFIPILVFVLLKAMTLVPLALGILGLKAWNALQLSFFSFVVSIGLAIFQLCKKIATDNAVPQISAHGPWDAAQPIYAARSLGETTDTVAHKMAYAGYV